MRISRNGKKGKQYKTDLFDGRRQNGGARPGAKSESMKGNINACEAFLDFDIEKRYGIPIGSMLETEILADMVSCVWLILTREGATTEEIK